MYQFIYYTLFVPVFIYGLYFLITGLFAFKKIPKKNKINNKKHKFAIVIAARNEENVIGHLIDSLKKQKYPNDKFDVFVVPNNCTDNTKQISVKHGAKIIECSDIVKSKGDVLEYSLNLLNKRNIYDAFIIFDADNIVHPDFIKKMNDVLCYGYELAQGFRDSKNPSDSWICGSYSLYYWGQNLFFNKSRMNMDASASINGTGFMIKSNIIDEIGFKTVTMTEDIEFTAQCAINNKKIVFVHDAITYDEQPLNFKTSWKQRMRWTTGTYQCLFTYYKPLLNGIIKDKNIFCLDMLLFFMAPIIQIIGCIVFLLLLIYTIFDIKLYDIFAYMFAHNEIFFILTYLISILFSILVVIINNKSIFKTILGILTFPIFLFSWIPINLICLFKRTLNWEPIIHNRNVSLETLIDD